MPAAFNGVFGHKPTGGLIPNTGQHPTTFHRFMVTGPLTRHSEDLLPMVAALAGPDGIDTCCGPIPLVRVDLPLAPAKAGGSDGGSGGGDAGGAAAEALTAVAPVRLSRGGNGSGAAAGSAAAGGAEESKVAASELETKDAAAAAGVVGTSPALPASPRSPTPRLMPPTPMPSRSTVGAHLPPILPPPHLVDDRVHPAITSWSQVTVFRVRNLDACLPLLSNRVDPAITAAMDVATDTLIRRYGCRGVEYVDLPELRVGFDLWAAVLSLSGQRSFRAWLEEAYEGAGGLHLGWELLRWCFGASTSTLPAIILALIEDIPNGPIFAKRQVRLVERCNALRERLCSALRAANGVLIFPVHPTVAPPHEVPLLRPFNVSFTQLFNVLEVPATVAPMGLDDAGLPVALQLIGATGFDRLTIAAACALEQAGVAGWVPPSSVVACTRCSAVGRADVVAAAGAGAGTSRPAITS